MARLNRRTVLRGLAAGGAPLALGAPVTAKPGGCRLRWRRTLNRHKPTGQPAINATQAVVNDIDRGTNGYWAYADYRRTLRAWPVDGGFRAVVTYVGQFDGVEGALSYTGGEPLTGDEAGTIHGGYAATIDGELLDDPAWPTHGFVGTTDYEGTIENTDSDPEYEGHRGNPVYWQDQYFDVDGFQFEWWGWIYRGGDCGTLTVEAGPERCGDVVCD